MQITVKHQPIFPDNPQNPAKCNVRTGVITLNDAVWNKLTPIEQAYWLAHEEGHIRTGGGSEVEADRFAFKKVAGTQQYSLRDIRRALRKIISTNPNAPEAKARIDSNMRLSLQMAADRGSESAKELLIKIPNNTMATLTTKSTTLMSSSNVKLTTAQQKAVQLSAKTTPTITAKAATTTKAATTPVATKATATQIATKSTTKAATTPAVKTTTATTARVNGTTVANRTILPVATGNTILTQEVAQPIAVSEKATVPATTKTQEVSGGVVDPTQPIVMEELPTVTEEGTKDEVAPQRAPETQQEPAVEQPATETKETAKKKNKNLIYAIIAVVVIVVGYMYYKSKKK